MDTKTLRHRVAFDKRPAVADDGAGNTVGDWTLQFERRASFIYDRGGETVQAARREGRAVFKCRVVADSHTRNIAQDWRMRDARTGDEYAILEVDGVTDRFWIYLVVERGVAA